ncbi:MAG: ras guanine nucleotide exchange factor domain-containing protein [Linnemannia elongata]|nr:MAG: ras guanine nucleotide exchange factor domain-containing protein [Linnemannia elongata]
MTPIPFINKRSSSQAYRQKVQQQQQQQQQQQRNVSPVPPLHQGVVSAGSNAALVFKDTVDEPVGAGGVHPLQGKANPLPPPPVDYLAMNMSFLDIPEGAIAAQLTCIEFLLFRKLKPRDMLRQVWKTSKGSAAFQACIAHFNFISSWVGTMILSQAKVKNRAKMMEKFISIAKLLRDMGNFNTTMAIIGAMNTSSIHRLMQTREQLRGKEIWTTFKDLERLMSSERSFFEYRAALKAQKLPCIPYLGVHLGDLLSISEGNKDFRQDGSIHWQKFCLLTEVISTVMHFQSEPYTIQPDPFISRAITDTHVLDDEEMYTKSVGAEPGKLHHSRSLSKFNFF